MFMMKVMRAMSSLKSTIQDISRQFTQALESAHSSDELEQIRVLFLGKKGHITQLLPQLKDLSADEKREVGPLIQELKNHAEFSIKAALDAFEKKRLAERDQKTQNFDVTTYKPHVFEGHLHPYTQIIEEIEDIFISMGYQVADGPQVETDYNNFTGLNIPQDHPARDMYDTFWLNVPGMLMRTHTSPVQVRTMNSQKPPFAVVVPGRTYRHEATDATHDFMFMQCEGFLVGKNVTLSNLFATAQTFLQAFFKKEKLDIRIRPGFFPFVEPGVEIDMQCPFCSNGCSICKHSRWIEVFPGGLIHPNVLKSANIDPQEYSGFAFGFGLTRLAMIKYKINDIRLFHSGKIDFLDQF
jgi:phenylalanyl-tRNA synthetase alpha chain